ncbi:MAG: fibronectin type III domain-containing protein [Clostridiales bacterium]|nr:fibronectin type III domain-containing protein [Clostridiales bacterium]
MKKFLSLFLSVLMLCSITAGLDLCAVAGSSSYSVSVSKTTYTYDSKAKKPAVTVKDSNGNKISSKYYTVSYISCSTGKTVSSMKSVGKYYVKVKMKGKYSGTFKKIVTIKPKSTSIKSLAAAPVGFTVKWGKVASQTTGYQIQYSTDSSFSAKTTKTVTKNTTTSKKITSLKEKTKYYVRVRTYKKVTVNGKTQKIYSSWSAAKSVTTQKCSHSYTGAKVTAKATTAKNGSMQYTCEICGKVKTVSIAKIASVSLSASSFTYDANAKSPSVTVTNSGGSKISSKYYTVSYISCATGKTVSSMTAVGKYYVSVKFKTRYSGTVKKVVTIKPAATSITSLAATANNGEITVKWGKVSAQITGYQLQYSTDSAFTSAQTVSVSGSSATSKQLSFLNAGQKYYVRVRTYKTVTVNGDATKLYSAWSSAVSVTTNCSHSYDSGTVTTPATPSADGVITYTCTVCGHVKTAALAKIDSITLSSTSYTYDATSKKPTATVKDSAGEVIDSAYYTITYINRETGSSVSAMKAVGKYYVRITFRGIYSGTVDKEISVMPKPATIVGIEATRDIAGEISLSWGNVATADGYELQYSLSSDFSNSTTKTISGTSLTSATIASLIGGATYYVRIRTYAQVTINGETQYIYSTWSDADEVETSDGYISVVTFNCAAPWGNVLDGTASSSRVKLFASYMNSLLPDSIGTQEMNQSWLNKLADLMPLYDSYGVIRGGDDTESQSEMNAVLWLKDKYTLIDKGTFWLSETPLVESIYTGAGCNRICTWVLLQNNTTGFMYIHMNTHLDNVSGAAQSYGATLILEKMQELQELYPDAAVVLTGDFNLYSSSSTYSKITSVLTDTRVAAGAAQSTTYHAWGTVDSGSPIDYIFTSSDRTVYSYARLDSTSGGYVSDHYGLMADISIN